MITVRSEALHGRGDITLFEPAGVPAGGPAGMPAGVNAARGLPLLILMHGVYGSHWAWALKGGAHRTAQAMVDRGEIRPLVIAMPSDGLAGDGTGYLPQRHADFERWIMADVVDCAHEVSSLLGPRSKLFLAGLSMGGYGAMRLGAKFADRVAGISGHSSATRARQLARFVAEPEAFNSADEALDPLSWMQRNRGHLPPLRFDCGTEDDLIEENRALHRSLTEQGIAHQYEEFPGGHTWAYWQEHFEATLRFVDGCLG